LGPLAFGGREAGRREGGGGGGREEGRWLNGEVGSSREVCTPSIDSGPFPTSSSSEPSNEERSEDVDGGFTETVSEGEALDMTNEDGRGKEGEVEGCEGRESPLGGGGGKVEAC